MLRTFFLSVLLGLCLSARGETRQLMAHCPALMRDGGALEPGMVMRKLAESFTRFTQGSLQEAGKEPGKLIIILPSADSPLNRFAREALGKFELSHVAYCSNVEAEYLPESRILCLSADDIRAGRPSEKAFHKLDHVYFDLLRQDRSDCVYFARIEPQLGKRLLLAPFHKGFDFEEFFALARTIQRRAIIAKNNLNIIDLDKSIKTLAEAGKFAGRAVQAAMKELEKQEDGPFYGISFRATQDGLRTKASYGFELPLMEAGLLLWPLPEGVTEILESVEKNTVLAFEPHPEALREAVQKRLEKLRTVTQKFQSKAEKLQDALRAGQLKNREVWEAKAKDLSEYAQALLQEPAF